MSTNQFSQPSSLGGWWTANPAAHWDEPDVWPTKPCMSNDVFGAQGKMAVTTGETVTIRFYVNADHSGIYQYVHEKNSKFMISTVVLWAVLRKHISTSTVERIIG
jgi:hypothetical protein